MAVNDDVEVRDRAAEKRLKAVAKVAGVAAERLTILSESEARLPNVGAEVTMYKVVDTRERCQLAHRARRATDERRTSTTCSIREQTSARDRYRHAAGGPSRARSSSEAPRTTACP